MKPFGWLTVAFFGVLIAGAAGARWISHQHRLAARHRKGILSAVESLAGIRPDPGCHLTLKPTASELSRPPSKEVPVFWAAFASLIAFTALGVYILYYPSDRLADIFGVSLLVTLGLGVLSGLVAIYTD